MQNSRPPYLPPPAPPSLPPPPAIAQLLPPVNFYSIPQFPAAAPSFDQFPCPPQLSQNSFGNVNGHHHPSFQNAAPVHVQHSTQFQPRYTHQRRWNRRQSVRVQGGNPRGYKLSGNQNASSMEISSKQDDKRKARNGQIPAQDVLTTLDAKLPGPSPADIEAWVTARKANWPSKANVERKEAAALKRHKAGALDTSSSQPPQGSRRLDCSQRDLVTSRNVFCRLNAKLPGSSPHEIEAWVAARKANWPSRTNVERKLAAEAEKKNETKSKMKEVNSSSGAMAKLEDYSSSEEEEEFSNRRQKKPTARRGKRTRRRQGGRGKDGLSRRRVETKTPEPKPTLLRMLLEREIRQEQSVLLQAFRYIITKKASETA
ncbi:unnamed protein product [Agarophyton chilense]